MFVDNLVTLFVNDGQRIPELEAVGIEFVEHLHAQLPTEFTEINRPDQFLDPVNYGLWYTLYVLYTKQTACHGATTSENCHV